MEMETKTGTFETASPVSIPSTKSAQFWHTKGSIREEENMANMNIPMSSTEIQRNSPMAPPPVGHSNICSNTHPLFMNPILSPFLSYLPQKQNSPCDVSLSSFAYKSDFIAEATRYRDLLQRYLNSMMEKGEGEFNRSSSLSSMPESGTFNAVSSCSRLANIPASSTPPGVLNHVDPPVGQFPARYPYFPASMFIQQTNLSDRPTISPLPMDQYVQNGQRTAPGSVINNGGRERCLNPVDDADFMSDPKGGYSSHGNWKVENAIITEDSHKASTTHGHNSRLSSSISSSSSSLSLVADNLFKPLEIQERPELRRDTASIDSVRSFQCANNDSSCHGISDNRPNSGSCVDEHEEPVWILRDSFVRKLKREEERKMRKEQGELRRLQLENLALADNALADEDESETDRLIDIAHRSDRRNLKQPDVTRQQNEKKIERKREVMIHEPAVLIEGVLFRARYLGSTQLMCDERPTKTMRMVQAQEAVRRVKVADDERQPYTDVDLFISTEKIMVLNAELQDIMMDHPLRTISYIADIGDLVVFMARRVSKASQAGSMTGRTSRITCHVFESDEAQFIAQSVGQAFQVAYMEFLRASGIDDTNGTHDVDYQEVLNAQEMFEEELESFARKETERDVIVPKQKGEMLGVVIVESGWGSMLPTVVIASLMPGGPAARSGQLNIGDHVITINGISLVGLPLMDCQNHVKNIRHLTAVKLTVVRTAPVVEVRMRRPDTKYQLGFSVQNGVICSLLRGGIGERGGVRVGHRIIEINSHSVVGVPHDTIVTMLASAVGEILMKTMPTSMYRLLTGQETPNYI